MFSFLNFVLSFLSVRFIVSVIKMKSAPKLGALLR